MMQMFNGCTHAFWLKYKLVYKVPIQWMHWSAELSLLHACMHDSCMCIAWLTVFGVITYPVPEQGCGTVLRVGVRHLAMSLYKLKASVTYLTWIMHLRAIACLHCPLLFLYAEYTSNAYFLSDYPYHLIQEGSDRRMDRKIDKWTEGRTKIAKRFQRLGSLTDTARCECVGSTHTKPLILSAGTCAYVLQHKRVVHLRVLNFVGGRCSVFITDFVMSCIFVPKYQYCTRYLI